MLLRPNSLDRRYRILVKTVALYALGKRTRSHAIVSRSLRSRAVPPQFFSELFIHLSLFLGYPSMLDGLEHVSSVSNPHRRATLKSRGGDAHKEGRNILERIYGDQTPKLLRHLDTLSPGLGHRITQDAYGLIMNRSGLTLQEREMANVVVLFIQGYDRQLYSHLRGALRVGVQRKTLDSIILLSAETANMSAKRALALLKKAEHR
jgi:4-carboxymuconolactone decarboxylase